MTFVLALTEPHWFAFGSHYGTACASAKQFGPVWYHHNGFELLFYADYDVSVI